MNNNISKEELEFLYESNNIENERSGQALMQAVHAWLYLREQQKITIHHLLKTHKILMLHSKTVKPNEKGYLRHCDVWIGGKRKVFISERLMKDELDDLFSRMNDPDKDEPGINRAWARNAHIEFEHIHPFVDGNGRVGRMIYNWHLRKMRLPIHIIHEGSEQQQYYQWFKDDRDWMSVREDYLAGKYYP